MVPPLIPGTRFASPIRAPPNKHRSPHFGLIDPSAGVFMRPGLPENASAGQGSDLGSSRGPPFPVIHRRSARRAVSLDRDRTNSRARADHRLGAPDGRCGRMVRAARGLEGPSSLAGGDGASATAEGRRHRWIPDFHRRLDADYTRHPDRHRRAFDGHAGDPPCHCGHRPRVGRAPDRERSRTSVCARLQWRAPGPPGCD